MKDFWKTEASKLADYVELGKLAIKRLREENRNLKANICSLKNVWVSKNPSPDTALLIWPFYR